MHQASRVGRVWCRCAPGPRVSLPGTRVLLRTKASLSSRTRFFAGILGYNIPGLLKYKTHLMEFLIKYVRIPGPVLVRRFRERLAMGSKQSQPADATPQEINEAEGKAAKKGGVSLTVGHQPQHARLLPRFQAARETGSKRRRVTEVQAGVRPRRRQDLTLDPQLSRAILLSSRGTAAARTSCP
jgi:hypothetical protein